MRLASLVSVLAVIASSIGCSSPSTSPSTEPTQDSGQDVASDTPEGGDAGEKCGGFTSTNPSCQTCLASSCCGVAEICGADAACVANLRSLHACTGESCSTMKPTDAAKALDACIWQSCSRECAGGTTDGINHGYKSIGDPCQSGDSCLSGKCSVAHQCVRACESDTDCAGYPDVDGKAVQHVCVQTQKTDKLCLPRCETQADCDKIAVTFPAGLAAKSEKLSCADVGGTHKACILARDKGPTPACYPNDTRLGGKVCESDDECLCGTKCDGHGCNYACTDNMSCTTVSNGVFNACMHGTDSTSCSNF